MNIRLVILESPLSGDTVKNTAYAREAMADSLSRGEAPMVSHLLYTQVLDDEDKEQRRYGILAGLAWGRVAEATGCSYTQPCRRRNTRLRIAAVISWLRIIKRKLKSKHRTKRI